MAIPAVLERQNFNVTPQEEAQLIARSDAELFASARQEGRVLFTRNIRDFLVRETGRRECRNRVYINPTSGRVQKSVGMVSIFTFSDTLCAGSKTLTRHNYTETPHY